MTTSFMAAVLPPPGSCRAGIKVVTVCLCVGGCVCASARQKKKGGEELMKEKHSHK